MGVCYVGVCYQSKVYGLVLGFRALLSSWTVPAVLVGVVYGLVLGFRALRLSSGRLVMVSSEMNHTNTVILKVRDTPRCAASCCMYLRCLADWCFFARCLLACLGYRV